MMVHLYIDIIPFVVVVLQIILIKAKSLFEDIALLNDAFSIDEG
jgi:hypothetical protein